MVENESIVDLLDFLELGIIKCLGYLNKFKFQSEAESKISKVASIDQISLLNPNDIAKKRNSYQYNTPSKKSQDELHTSSANRNKSKTSNAISSGSQFKSKEMSESLKYNRPRINKSVFHLTIQNHNQLIKTALENNKKDDKEEWPDNESENSFQKSQENSNVFHNNAYSLEGSNKAEIDDEYKKYLDFFEQTFIDGAKYFFPNRPNFFIYWKLDYDELGYDRFDFSFITKRFKRNKNHLKQDFQDESSKFPIRLGLYYFDLLESLYKIIEKCDKTLNFETLINLSSEVYNRLQDCKADESFKSQEHEEYSTLNSKLKEYIKEESVKNISNFSFSSQPFVKNFQCFVDFDLSQTKFQRVLNNTNLIKLNLKQRFCKRIIKKYSNINYVPRNRNVNDVVDSLGLNQPQKQFMSKIEMEEKIRGVPGRGKYLYKVFLRGSKKFQSSIVRGVDISIIKKI